MKTQYIIAQATVISATVLMLGTACSSHKAVPASQHPIANQNWEAPATIKGKTFIFSAPFSLRITGEGSRQDNSHSSQSIVWKWGNKKKITKYDNGDEFFVNKYEYRKTGPKTAELKAMCEGGFHSAMRPEEEFNNYTLIFETPSSGACSLENFTVGPGHRERYTASGRFVLK